MYPLGKLAFSNIAEGRANSTTPVRRGWGIWQYLTKVYVLLSTFNPAIPFLETFQKIDPHSYEPTYIHKVTEGGIISNKKNGNNPNGHGRMAEQTTVNIQSGVLCSCEIKKGREPFLEIDVISRTHCKGEKKDAEQGI